MKAAKKQVLIKKAPLTILIQSPGEGINLAK
jgi:hypothetical protein